MATQRYIAVSQGKHGAYVRDLNTGKPVTNNFVAGYGHTGYQFAKTVAEAFNAGHEIVINQYRKED
jgi:hypothetical protein